MISIKMDKGRLKVGKYSLSGLAIAEAVAAIVFAILTIIVGIGGFRDMMTYFAWNNALLAYSSNQSGLADAKLQTCLKYRSEFADPHLMAAKIRVDSGDYTGAQDEYERVLRLQPNSEAAHIGLGVIALRQWDQKKGAGDALLNLARSEFSLAGGSTDALIAMGHVALRSGNLTEADKAFSEAAQSPIPPSLDGVLDLYIGEATVAVQRQNWTRAVEGYERVRFINPYFERGHANISHVRVRLAETMEIDREKMNAYIQETTIFSQTLQGFAATAGENQSRAYFRPALAQYLASVACVLVRSDAVDAGTTRLQEARATEGTNKRHVLNYLATLTELIRKDPPNWRDDQRLGALFELERVANLALRDYSDLTVRERAICYHYLSIRFSLRSEDGEHCVQNAALALEKLTDGGVSDDHLKAMIFRAMAVGWFNRRVGEVNPSEKAKCVEQAVNFARQSLELENDPDFSTWADKIRR
ncbi:MAG: tetratricopeptide repeat protein [Candidatus Brocadiae bacterium]|nr:tetratricopeptide repeat protein [Candidatus Brocadiia bacterium]